MHDEIQPAIQRFLSDSTIRAHPAGRHLLRAGDRPRQLFYICSGSVEVTMIGESGDDLLLARLGQGQFFGELELFLEPADLCCADVRTRTACEIAEMAYPRVRQLVTQTPALLLELSRQLATRLKRANRWRLDLARG